ncbi:MAG TPA: helix-turn-helix domain-containing protein [Caulobacteraceae bacterium]|nr:helix-turn-helix domain-containing protein [Caulobacteraceae bacterium]
MISNLQIRAARALLGWSQQRLADEAGVSPITIKRLEASDEVFQARFETVIKVKAAVEAAGVVFRTGEDGLVHGVSLRRPDS